MREYFYLAYVAPKEFETPNHLNMQLDIHIN